VRNLERCVTWEGFIRRKQRAEFETFLQHDDPRVRAMAEDLKRVLRSEPNGSANADLLRVP